jgi:hypothetical protein
MRMGVSLLCAVLLTVFSAAALPKRECYEAAKRVVVPLLMGDHADIGPVNIEKPGGWVDWLTDSFPGEGKFSAYSGVAQENNGSVCRASIRIKKSGGALYAMFAEFDQQARLVGMFTVRESLEQRQQELMETLTEFNTILPGLKSGDVDDLAIVPLLKRLSRTARGARKDIDDYLFILEDPIKQLTR